MGRKIAGLARRSVGLGLALFVFGCLLSPWNAAAEKVPLKDGRTLEGRFALLQGVAVNPINAALQNNDGTKFILMCDNDLTYTLVPKRLAVLPIDPSATPQLERFKISQPVAENGNPVASIGGIIEIGPFDAFGRRTFSMQTPRGPVNVIQGLTEITPVWSKLEALRGGQNYLWDMRIATNSISRPVLSAVLLRQIDRKNPDHRLKIVRFYMQAERFQDAENELKQVIIDFPTLQGLDDQIKALRQLSARRLLDEVEMRRKSGQYRLAGAMLERFPTDNISGPVLQEVRDKIVQYRDIQGRGEETVKLITALVEQVKDRENKRQLKPICAEIAAELTVGTLDRMASFRRLADDTDLLPEQRLSLAISGWLLGSNEAVDNIQVALSLVEVRNSIRQYLNEPVRPKRQSIVESLGSQQGTSPKLVAALLAHMKPPLDTPEQESAGFYKLSVHGVEDEPDVVYYVQLPPEYDPHRQYPTVLTLNGAGTTPEQQIDWWAGVPKETAPDDAGPAPAQGRLAPPAPKPDEAPVRPDSGSLIRGLRMGQATRQGYIVIAPAWMKPHQDRYEYSAREHAAVLAVLRDACRRFSVDTDRVFLSGHSLGGDAAWDIALAHPDLWAGVIPIVATADKYIAQYWPNGARVPMYFINGEMDGTRVVTDSRDWDRYLQRGYDTTIVEYLGRGHENFSDEILRLFDWMGRKKRDFFPRDFSAVTMREFDNFFWCVELTEMQPANMVDPVAWPPPKGTHPLKLEGKATANNGITIQMSAAKVTLWLSPEWVNFDRPITLSINGNRIGTRQSIKPSISVILDDVRTRGDRQHPFWAKVQ